MGEFDWRMEMYALAAKNEWCRQMSERVARFAPAYLALRNRLTEEEWDALEMYISACEQQKYSYIYPAYELGRRHGRKMQDPPE